MIILDTDVLIEISEKQSKKGEEVFQKIISGGDEVAITSITLYEMLYGLMKLDKPFQQLLSFHVFDFTKQAAQHAARLEFDLEKKGMKIKRTDIMIASIAIIQGAILCTFDSDFQKTKEFGLKLFR